MTSIIKYSVINSMTRLLFLPLAFGLLSSVGAPSEVSNSRIPQQPKTFKVPYTLPTSRRTIYVNQGDDLQAAFDKAVLGDVILLQAGARFTGNFKLPAKTGDGWIYIVSSELDQLQEGVRVGPTNSIHMPKIVSPNSDPALFTVFAAHNYRFAGVEISTSSNNYNLVLMGYGLANYSDPLWKKVSADSVDKLPYNITFDRCYLHSTSDVNFSRTGINADGKYIAIIDSYLENFKDTSDAQAILIWNGSGPFKIVNNYLEAAGENVLFGGADPKIANLVPGDIEVRGNYFYKPMIWNPSDPSYNGHRWTTKNLLELKNAQRVLISGNIFENNWGTDGGQQATAIVFTVRNQSGTAPWSIIQDVTFENNIIRDVSVGLRITGEDGPTNVSEQTQRILIKNNLVVNMITTYNAQDRAIDISTPKGKYPVLDLTIQNNLFLHVGAGNAFMTMGDYTTVAENLVFENNIVTHADYGLFGSAVGDGMPALNRYVSTYSFEKNVIISRTCDRTYSYDIQNFASLYPPGNFHVSSMDEVGFADYHKGDYRLKDSSKFRKLGTDRKDLGPNINTITEATKDTLSGRRHIEK